RDRRARRRAPGVDRHFHERSGFVDPGGAPRPGPGTARAREAGRRSGRGAGRLQRRPAGPGDHHPDQRARRLLGVRGTGAGHTWDAGTPHARIDYVLVTPDVAIRSVATVPTDASDHLPVVAELMLPVPRRL